LNQKSTAVGRIHVIRGNHRLGNSSFLNYIFLKDEMLGNEKMEQILQHELLHVKWLHSIDLLIFELAKIILWFNPFIYLYSRAVKENHEFEVDHEIGRIADKKEYADLILQLCIGKEKALFHTFSKMPLEKRINMLFSKPTNNLKKLIYLLILPSFGLSCLAFADFRVTNDVLKISPQDVHSNNQIIGRQDKKTDLKSVIIPEVHNIQTDIIFKNSIREQKKERNFTEDPKSNQSAENSETSTLATSFFSREHVENSDGKNIDKITFQLFNGSASAVLGKDDKLGAFIDGHFYDEDAIRKLPSSKTALLIFDRSENVAKTDNIPEGNFAIPFSFKTKAVMTERY